VAIRALLPGTEVIGVEPELAADARDSLRQGAEVLAGQNLSYT
jgi:threonine dehydratase